MYATNHLHPRLSRAIRTYCKANNTPLDTVEFVIVEMKIVPIDRRDVLQAHVVILGTDYGKPLHAVPLVEIEQSKNAPFIDIILDLWEVIFHKK